MSKLTVQYEIEDECGFQLALMQTRKVLLEFGFRASQAAKLLTAASELARNILKYAGHGSLTLDEVVDGERRGIVLTAIDQGQGIADIDEVMQDHFSSGGTLGQGLPGARRLVDEFEIWSELGKGTRIRVVLWL